MIPATLFFLPVWCDGSNRGLHGARVWESYYVNNDCSASGISYFKESCARSELWSKKL